MTKIKMLNDRIIFDGHADSRQECETITLLCDNLAQSKDFKTIRYESGYAEFEKVGKTEELKFVSEPMNCTINFDSHVTKVEVTNEYEDTYTWTTSGQTFLINGNSYTTYIFTVTLENGFEISTVQATEAEQYEILSFSNNQITAKTYYSGIGSGFTITTKAAATKQTIDVSTLAGWATLATGNHQITIKTKASGYVDSAASNAVTISKAASGYTVTFGDGSESGSNNGAAYYSIDNGATYIRFCTINADTSNDYLVTDISGVTQIKFKLEVEAGMPPTRLSLICEKLGVSIGGKSGTFTSDNYTLTEDVAVLISN